MGKMIELKLSKFLLAEEPTKEYVGVEWIFKAGIKCHAIASPSLSSSAAR